jgi:hypothetical protein
LGRGKTYEAIMTILLVKLPQSEVSFDETEGFFTAGYGKNMVDKQACQSTV